MDFVYGVIARLFEWIQGLGYLGITLGLMLEVIPSEIVLAYGGYLVELQEINFFGALAAGTIGGVAAQLFIYWIGRYGGRPVLEKYGKYLLIQKKHIDYAEEWFKKYGSGVIFTARFVPVVRHAISIPAGISKMNLGRFIWLTTLAVIPWMAFFLYLGMLLGDQWVQIDEKASPYIREILLAALALMIIYFVLKWFKTRKERNQHVC